MEKALTKLGSFTIPRKAKQELSAIGGDISVSAPLLLPSFPPSRVISLSLLSFSLFVAGFVMANPFSFLVNRLDRVKCRS